MPHMNDPIFSKCLIYVCEHNKDGTMGLIINKPMISENATEIKRNSIINFIEFFMFFTPLFLNINDYCIIIVPIYLLEFNLANNLKISR